MTLEQEELLKEAINRYPIGTQFTPAHIDGPSKPKTVSGIPFLCGNSVYVDSTGDNIFMSILWSDGKKRWAPIVSTPPEKEEEPKFKFSLGESVVEKEGVFFYTDPILYVSGFSTSNCVRNCGTIIDRKRVGEYNWYKFSNYMNWITEEGLEYITDREDLLEKAKILYSKGTRYMCAADKFTTPQIVDRTHKWVGRDKMEAGMGYIYYEGKWATIVAEEKKKEYFPYKAGDWIVGSNILLEIYGVVIQIDRVEPYDNNTYKIYAKKTSTGEIDWFNSNNIIRKALPHEIPIYTNPIWEAKYLQKDEKGKDYSIGTDPYFNTIAINKQINVIKKMEDVSGYIQQAVTIKKPRKSSIISV